MYGMIEDRCVSTDLINQSLNFKLCLGSSTDPSDSAWSWPAFSCRCCTCPCHAQATGPSSFMQQLERTRQSGGACRDMWDCAATDSALHCVKLPGRGTACRRYAWLCTCPPGALRSLAGAPLMCCCQWLHLSATTTSPDASPAQFWPAVPLLCLLVIIRM